MVINNIKWFLNRGTWAVWNWPANERKELCSSQKSVYKSGQLEDFCGRAVDLTSL